MANSHSPRGLLYLHGPEAENLLQGTLTQDVRGLAEGEIRYAAHLTPQGRIIADALVSQYENGEKSGFLLDVHPKALMPLAHSLHKYALQGGVEFEDVTEDICIQFFPEDEKKGMADPRNGEFLTLPRRVYFPRSTQTQPFSSVSPFVPLLGNGKQDPVPELFPMLAHTRLLPAEADLAALHGVSFTKGCYVGQEVVSRLHHKTKPKKRLYLVENTDDLCKVRAGDTLQTKEGALAGTVLQNGNTAEKEIFAILSVRYVENELFCQGRALQGIHLPAYSTKIDAK